MDLGWPQLDDSFTGSELIRAGPQGIKSVGVVYLPRMMPYGGKYTTLKILIYLVV